MQLSSVFNLIARMFWFFCGKQYKESHNLTMYHYHLLRRQFCDVLPNRQGRHQRLAHPCLIGDCNGYAHARRSHVHIRIFRQNVAMHRQLLYPKKPYPYTPFSNGNWQNTSDVFLLPFPNQCLSKPLVLPNSIIDNIEQLSCL